MQRLFALVLLTLFFAVPAWGAADDIALQRNHKGITLLALKVDPNKTYDTSLLPAAQALKNLTGALDRLIAKSPLSRRRLNDLKKSGEVRLVYLPGDLNPGATGGMTLASFLPDFLQDPKKRDRKKVFLVVVGRHGVKWPADELAAILAHELVGHGVQHWRGRLTNIRVLDAECEAYLYEEAANQDLGLDKRGREMVSFRQALEDHWCADFKIYMRAHQPKKMAIWDTLNPDIPKLLAVFEKYLDFSAQQGITGKSVSAADKQLREKRRRNLENASPEEIIALVLKLRDGGIGVEQDKEEALRYLKIVAERGHLQAQYVLGSTYAKGTDVTRDFAEAIRWFRMAAKQGNAQSQFILGVMNSKGFGTSKDKVKAYQWFARAVSNGGADAKTRDRARSEQILLKKAMSPDELARAKQPAK